MRNGDIMSVITIADMDEELERRLERLAAAHGRSLEEEVRHILGEVLALEPPVAVPGNLGVAIRAIVEPLGGVSLDLPRREPIRTPPSFE